MGCDGQTQSWDLWLWHGLLIHGDILRGRWEGEIDEEEEKWESKLEEIEERQKRKRELWEYLNSFHSPLLPSCQIKERRGQRGVVTVHSSAGWGLRVSFKAPSSLIGRRTLDSLASHWNTFLTLRFHILQIQTIEPSLCHRWSRGTRLLRVTAAKSNRNRR